MSLSAQIPSGPSRAFQRVSPEGVAESPSRPDPSPPGYVNGVRDAVQTGPSRVSAPTREAQNETDMAAFEGALAERWCHITPVLGDGSEGTRYTCGLPVDEPTHADCADVNGHCVICKRPCCPDCDRIWDERYA